jgi:integrase
MVARWLPGFLAKITKRVVDALKPAPDHDVVLWDDEIPGFGVRCRPSGAKSYLLKYRTRGGRQRWLTLGEHGSMTPEQARKAARLEKAAVADGADPAGERDRKRQEVTVAAVADRYLSEHVAAHNKPSTAAEARRIVETRIKPKLGAIKITELTRADVKAWHQATSATPYEANRAFAYLSKMLTLAATEWQLRADNPCTGIKRFPEKKRERFFADVEFSRIGEVLAATEREGIAAPGFILLVRVLATTGLRLGEALALDWADIDLPGRAIRLRDARAGARTVHIGAAAVTILDAVADKSGPVVQDRDGGPLTAGKAQHAWARLRQRAGLPGGRLHDLRHSVGTFAAVAGANAFVVRDLLGHRTLAMTGRYVERAADMVRATADAVAGRVAAALNTGSRTPAEVRKLPQRR